MATRIKQHVKPRTRELNCPDVKINYYTKKEALQQAAKALTAILFPYKCPHCHKWHLTSTEPEEKRKTYKQICYLIWTLTFEDDFWSCYHALPGKQFATVKDLRDALNQL